MNAEPLYFYQSFEFKGKTIKPSKGRIDMAMAAGMRIDGQNPVTQVDILILIYCCRCPQELLMYAQRDPAKFFGFVMEWRDMEVSDEDLVTLTSHATDILKGAQSTKAEPITDPNFLPDPTEGN